MKAVRCVVAHVVAGVVLVFLLASCGANARDKALRTSVVALNAVSDGLAAYDEQHQRTILEASPDRAAFDKELANYRVKRADVESKIAGAYRAIAAAAVINKDHKSLDAVGTALNLAFDAIKDFTGGNVAVPTGGLP